jgi:hypothetical protein
LSNWPAPTWLDVDDVVEWLRAAPVATADPPEVDLLTRCTAAAEPYVFRLRPDAFALTTDPDPPVCVDAEVYGAAVMVAARSYLRRNTPVGVESFSASVAYTSSVDLEIARALRISATATQYPRTDAGPAPVTP